MNAGMNFAHYRHKDLSVLIYRYSFIFFMLYCADFYLNKEIKTYGSHSLDSSLLNIFTEDFLLPEDLAIFFYELQKNKPKNVTLLTLDIQHNTINLHGKTTSLDLVHRWLLTWKNTVWSQDPQLQTQHDKDTLEFLFDLKLTREP